LSDNSRIFHISEEAADTTLTGLVLTGGRTTQSGGEFGGGAVYSRSALTVTNSVVAGNSTTGDGATGGGISGKGAVTLDSSEISGNSTSGETASGGGVSGFLVDVTNSAITGNSTSSDRTAGGGIFGFDVTVTSSSVSGNSVSGYGAAGGGIAAANEANLIGSTVSGNTASGTISSGGGILGTTVYLINSTVADNAATAGTSTGGGISGLSEVFLVNSTVSGNLASGDISIGGGIAALDGSVSLVNSIVLGNSALVSGSSEIQAVGASDGGGNIIGGQTKFDQGTEDRFVTAADVFAETYQVADGIDAGVLSDNGGPVETILLKVDASNPALDAGDVPQVDLDGDGIIDGPLGEDARGSGRDVDLSTVDDAENGGSVDAGAVELQNDEAARGVDDTATTRLGEAVTISPLENDISLDGSEPRITDVGEAENGSVVDNGDGTLGYTPDAAFFGEDAFTYTIETENGAFASATVRVSVLEAQSLVVTTEQDVVDGLDGLTSLREAIAYANGLENGDDADRITFDNTVFFGEGQPVIRLTEGELEITDAV
ncbi:cadherin-like domain-containing protein, partial [Roseibium sp. RKSG952]|uniref:Ig-like domain-containing protein n=1 Tax=Roseibium sp. RKSG952 TaxID=2529384 RepID=UPI0018AD1CF6